MLRKRLIFALIYANGFYHQSRNFRLQKVGNANWLKNNYKLQKISFSLDELVVVDASRDGKSMVNLANEIRALSSGVFIPLAAGGGISSIEDARRLFGNGADKIVVNSLLVQDPREVEKIVEEFGSQSVIASVDYRIRNGSAQISTNNGEHAINDNLSDYLRHIEQLGVGEILLNSINMDGTGFGYDIETISSVVNITALPVICMGGAGNFRHFDIVLAMDGISAACTANILNFVGDGLPRARRKLVESGHNLANWE